MSGIGCRVLLRRIAHLSRRARYRHERSGAPLLPADLPHLWEWLSEPWLRDVVGCDPEGDDLPADGGELGFGVGRQMLEMVVAGWARGEVGCVGFFETPAAGRSRVREVVPREWVVSPLTLSSSGPNIIEFGPTVVRYPTFFLAKDLPPATLDDDFPAGPTRQPPVAPLAIESPARDQPRPALTSVPQGGKEKERRRLQDFLEVEAKQPEWRAKTRAGWLELARAELGFEVTDNMFGQVWRRADIPPVWRKGGPR